MREKGFAGAYMNGDPRALIEGALAGTLVGLKHYIETGEKVNPSQDNYKEVKKKHPQPVDLG